MRSLPGRCHELLHNRAGQLSLDLVHPLRLIFEPANIPIPRKADGGIDWQKVTAVVIIGIVDILAAVKRTAIPKPHDLGFGRELLRSTKAHAEVRTETGDGRRETGDGRRETAIRDRI
ncbi:MAG: hypothetical protein O9276_11135 [Microcystis sp. LE17-20A]|uniref:hypothetical protein n=1 Tax=Microcystis sp. LE17-20A TaxID=3016430 RepID=UPI0022BCA51B|nr:hypothetical protein [Microcystis sp. LE17-20A]MCZ8038658.1 hypothetical protein [Microcystis sp. LE17-20A]